MPRPPDIATQRAGSGSVVLGRPPVELATALAALVACAGRTVALLARRRLHQPREHVGSCWRFADGTEATVYRETRADRDPDEPVLLVVGFRLRRVRSRWGHALFRAESVLNTVLFAGFPGFVTKLWFADDDRHLYRGVYEWDGADRAVSYVRSLWWVLALVSERDSIRAAVLPGLRRAQLLADVHVADAFGADEPHAWWRVTGARAPLSSGVSG